MEKYHKIQTVFKRDPENKFKTLLMGEYALPELEYLATNNWMFTEKIDGTNIRVMFDGEKITFGGKTDNAQIPAFLIEKLNDTFLSQIDLFKETFTDTDSVCLYGEGYGAKIQKSGGNYRQDQSFALFDIRIGDWWLKRIDVSGIAIKFGLDLVPTVGEGTLWDMVKLVGQGFNSHWGSFIAEGIVARPATELQTRGGQRIITKIKHRDFQ